MLIAATTNEDGRKRLIVGLHAENIERLLNDEPILKRLDGERDVGDTEGVKVEGLEEWDLIVLGPEDLARFVAAFGGRY